MNKHLLEFLNEVEGIHEHDYGDFKRKAHHYLTNLSLKITPQQSRRIRRGIFDMDMYLQYVPRWNVEYTKHRLLLDTNSLNDVLKVYSLES